jgi:hypothetical protein
MSTQSQNELERDVMHMLVTHEFPKGDLRATASSLEYSLQAKVIAQYIAEKYISKADVLAAIEDTTAMKQDGLIWIGYKDLKARLSLPDNTEAPTGESK